MKTTTLLYLILSCTLVLSCADDDTPALRPSATGTYTDSRDGQTYTWVRLGEQEWMTSNLRYGTPYNECRYGGPFLDEYGNPQRVWSYHADFDYPGDIAANGNLYTWEEATSVCPDGWRLPSDEDWQRLEQTLGLSPDQASSNGWRGNHLAELVRQGDDGTGLLLPLSGCAWRSNSYSRYLFLTSINELGYFWSSSFLDTKKNRVYFRKISSTQPGVYRGTASLDILMRVRCVRDVQP